MNALQHLSEKKHGPVLVTLNPPFEVDKDKEVGRYKYEHPIYSLAVSLLFISLGRVRIKRPIYDFRVSKRNRNCLLSRMSDE